MTNETRIRLGFLSHYSIRLATARDFTTVELEVLGIKGRGRDTPSLYDSDLTIQLTGYDVIASTGLRL